VMHDRLAGRVSLAEITTIAGMSGSIKKESRVKGEGETSVTWHTRTAGPTRK
jgi:hypothetical protein